MNKNGVADLERYIPNYNKLDECLETNNGPCLWRIFKKFHGYDLQLAKDTVNPKIRAANYKFARDYFVIVKTAINQIRRTGKMDLRQFNRGHKKVNNDLGAAIEAANADQ